MARSNIVGKLRDIVEAQEDPKIALWKALGDLEGQIVLHCQVLVATYAGSKYHAGTTILKTDAALKENQFQGSTGLVVAVGPGAFEDGPNAKFYGLRAKVGDWVLTRPSDGLNMSIKEVPCRLYDDVNIRMIVDDPELYW